MSKATDPALYESGFERIEKDRYWTQPWITSALLSTIYLPDGVVWEPSCGRGDMVRVLLDYGYEVEASDIDMSEFDSNLCRSRVANFLDVTPGNDVTAIVMNPPYNQPRGIAEGFVRHALDLMSFTNVQFVAALLRSEFCRAKGRRDIFGDCEEYAGEVVLTSRPRWDWWFRDEPEASPRHNFSWFFWEVCNDGPARQLFHYKERERKKS